MSIELSSALLVVGAPRSGTSLVCDVLSRLGVDFGDPALFVDPGVNRHNPVFFELVELNRINDEMMAAMGWEFSDFTALPLPSDFTSVFADQFEERVNSFLETYFTSSATIGLKDPRFCFTLPLWTLLLSRRGINVNYLLTLRHENAVTASNYRLNPDRGMQYAKRIGLLSEGAARLFLRGLPTEEIHFEQLAAHAEVAFDALSRVTNVDVPSVEEAVAEVFDRALVHWEFESKSTDSTGLSERYESMAKLSREFVLPIAGGITAPASYFSSSEIASIHDFGPFARRSDEGNASGIIQLFYRTTTGFYSEDASRSYPWPPGSSIVEGHISFHKQVEADFIRIDFDEYPGAYYLRSLQVNGKDQSPKAIAKAANGVVLTNQGSGVGVIANHSDPWLELSVEGGVVNTVTMVIDKLSIATACSNMFEIPDFVGRVTAVNGRVAALEDRITSTSERFGRQLGQITESLQQQKLSIVRFAETQLKTGDQLLSLITSLVEERNTRAKRRWSYRFRRLLGHGGEED